MRNTDAVAWYEWGYFTYTPIAADQPYNGQQRHKQHTAPYGRLDESQVHQARYEIARPVLVGCEVVVNAEPIPLVTIPA